MISIYSISFIINIWRFWATYSPYSYFSSHTSSPKTWLPQQLLRLSSALPSCAGLLEHQQAGHHAIGQPDFDCLFLAVQRFCWKDNRFIMWKPTVLFWIGAIVMLFSHLAGKTGLKPSWAKKCSSLILYGHAWLMHGLASWFFMGA